MPTPERSLAPSAAPAPPARPVAHRASAAEEAHLRAFYIAREQQQLAQGLRRLDGNAVPVPTDPDLIADIYADVALRDEYRRSPDGFRPTAARAALRRWERPVAYRLQFGRSVPAEMRATDREEVARVAGILAEATRHPIRLLPAGRVTGGNFHILVLNPQERRDAAPRLRTLVPSIDNDTLSLIANLPNTVYCLVVSFTRNDDT